MAAELRYTQDGLPYYEGVDLSWVDQTPQPILAATPSDPYEMAAARVALANKRGGKLPIAYPEAVKEQKPTSYIMEPDLLETQGGMRLPTDVNINDGGVPFNTTTGKDISIVRRPNVLPIAFTPDGPTLAMPKMLDIVGNVMSPLIAGKVPVKAGEMVLGSGMVRTAEEAAKEAGPFYSALERAVDTAKIDKADASQWMGYLKNQPGVKAEELQYVLGHSLPEGVQINKQELKGLMNKVELKEKVLGQSKLNVVPLEEEPHILQIFRADDPTGEVSGMVGEIVKQQKGGREVYKTNVPEIENRFFNTQKEAEDYVLKNTDFGAKTKYHSYQLPGGENYKEMLLQLPKKDHQAVNDFEKFKQQLELKYNTHIDSAYDAAKITGDKSIGKQYQELLVEAQKVQGESGLNYKSSHWEGEPNVLAHIRMNDRIVDGKKTLHLEEIQSDWHQAGRKQGYKLDTKEFDRLFTGAAKTDQKLIDANAEHIMGNPDLATGLRQAVKENIITQKEADDYIKLVTNENSNIPDAPFKKTWDELALKRMLHKAAKEGYEGISWTPGEAQAARYDLSKQVKSIHWEPSIADKSHSLVQIHPNDGKALKVQVDKNGKIIDGFPSSQVRQWEGKNLSDVVGKEHADKILGKKEGSLEGEGLKIGGEGMKAFYDKMLVDRANALGKKYGSKVEKKQIDVTGGKPLNSKDHGPDGLFPDGIGEVHYLPITPELRKKSLEGFPLFSNSPILTPVTNNPFNNDEKKKFKLVPVQGNPFQ